MSLHVEVVGQGKPLVMIHGWGSNGAIFHAMTKLLSNQFTLHLVDLPGAGMSRPIDPYHLYALAEQVAITLPAHADILGWSLGGQVAMRLALDRPDMVCRLVLVGTTPCFVTKPDWEIGVQPRVFNDFAKAVNDDYQKTMLQNITLQCMNAKDARKTIKILREKFLARPAANTQAIMHGLQLLLDTDLREEVQNLRKPTLLIHGDRDNLAPLQAAHWMMQNLPAGFLRVMSGAAHAPFLSHQAQFVEALTQFLEPV
ncbi:MAG: pimeloyl-ACP methyl ester esterase BioH [Methylophilaceae bacterium]